MAKISYQPARLLGLANKGSLTAGRDADITIVDRLQRSAFATIIGGQVCYMDGKVLGRGGRIITTAAGADYVRSQGLEPLVVDLADSSLLQKAQKDDNKNKPPDRSCSQVVYLLDWGYLYGRHKLYRGSR